MNDKLLNASYEEIDRLIEENNRLFMKSLDLVIENRRVEKVLKNAQLNYMILFLIFITLASIVVYSELDSERMKANIEHCAIETKQVGDL